MQTGDTDHRWKITCRGAAALEIMTLCTEFQWEIHQPEGAVADFLIALSDGGWWDKMASERLVTRYYCLGWHLGQRGVMEAWLFSWCCPVPSLLALDKFQPLLLPGNPAARGTGAPLAAGAALTQAWWIFGDITDYRSPAISLLTALSINLRWRSFSGAGGGFPAAVPLAFSPDTSSSCKCPKAVSKHKWI